MQDAPRLAQVACADEAGDERGAADGDEGGVAGEDPGEVAGRGLGGLRGGLVGGVEVLEAAREQAVGEEDGEDEPVLRQRRPGQSEDEVPGRSLLRKSGERRSATGDGFHAVTVHSRSP
jgi:hypothetical protein